MKKYHSSKKVLALAVMATLLEGGNAWAAQSATNTVTTGNASTEPYTSISVDKDSAYDALAIPDDKPATLAKIGILHEANAADVTVYMDAGAGVKVNGDGVNDSKAYGPGAIGIMNIGTGTLTINGAGTLGITATATDVETGTITYDKCVETDGICNASTGNIIIAPNVTIKSIATGAKVAASSKDYGTVANGIYCKYINDGSGYLTLKGSVVLDVQATGSQAETAVTGNVYTMATGFYNMADGNTITIEGSLSGDVAAKGSNNPAADAAVKAVGITNWPSSVVQLNGPTNMTVSAAGGMAKTQIIAAVGIDEQSIDCITTSQPVTLTVTAVGGKESQTEDIYAYGLRATKKVTGDVILTKVAAVGGISPVVTAKVSGICSANDTSFNNVTMTEVSAAAGSAETSAVTAAAGIFNLDGTLQINGDTVICTSITNALALNSQDYAAAVIAKNSTAVNNINTKDGSTSLGKTVKLVGDVLAAKGGVNNIILNGSSSYLQGNVRNSFSGYSTGTNNLTVTNGAIWQPVFDNRNSSFTDTANAATLKQSYTTAANSIAALNLTNAGIVNLTWDNATRSDSFRTLTIDKLTGDGGIFKVNTDLANSKGDQIILGSSSTSTSVGIDVAYDPYLATSGFTANSGTAGNVVVLKDTSQRLTSVKGVTDSYNLYDYEPTIVSNGDNTYSVTKLTITNAGKHTVTTPSRPMREARHERMAMHNLWVNGELNSLQKRLGDLRAVEPAESGIWTRYERNKVEKGDNASLKYNMFQLGYDKDYKDETGIIYRGAAVSYTKGTGDYEVSTGDLKQGTLSLYQTWVGNDGRYSDIIFKCGKIMSNYDYYNTLNPYSADYHTWAYSISGEMGKRFKRADGFYVEPQAELTLGRINGADYTTSTGMDVSASAQKQAIFRLGIGIGQETANGSCYFKGSYYHDFGGGINLLASDSTTNPFSYSEDSARNWAVFTLGGQVRAGANCDIYGELSKYAGQLTNDVLVNVGARWSF